MNFYLSILIILYTKTFYKKKTVEILCELKYQKKKKKRTIHSIKKIYIDINNKI